MIRQSNDNKPMLAYLLRLGRSSFRIIWREGPFVYLKLLIGWLNGKRGAYHPNDRPDPISYTQFIKHTSPDQKEYQRQTRHAASQGTRTQFNIVSWMSSGSDTEINTSMKSLKLQTYPYWKWHIITKHKINTIDDDRVIVISSEDNFMPEGDYIVFLDIGDMIPVHGLYTVWQYTRSYQEVDFFYSDWDEYYPKKMRERTNPFFKPGWSPEMLLSVNILHNLGICRRSVWDALRPFNSAWDFALRVSEHTDKIRHIPHVLCHRLAERPGDRIAEDKAITTHLRRLGMVAPIVSRDNRGMVRVQWELTGEPRISIIIPSRDKRSLIERCLSTIFDVTSYTNYEVIVVDTGSTETETWALYEDLKSNSQFNLVNFEPPFNYSAACNYGAAHANGELLLFLNNDTEVLHSDWLQLMAQWFELPDIGVVGAKLLYPDGKIQHIGVIIGLYGLVAHVMSRSAEHVTTVFGSDDWYRNYLAVTGACQMISRRVFDEIDGFDESYVLNNSDIELCLAAYKKGYRIVYTPHVRLIHHESATHQRNIPLDDTYRFNERVISWLRRGDPFYNPNLSIQDHIPSFKRRHDDNPIDENKVLMAAIDRQREQKILEKRKATEFTSN